MLNFLINIQLKTKKPWIETKNVSRSNRMKRKQKHFGSFRDILIDFPPSFRVNFGRLARKTESTR